MSDIKTKFINDPENITAELLEGYEMCIRDRGERGKKGV